MTYWKNEKKRHILSDPPLLTFSSPPLRVTYVFFFNRQFFTWRMY